MAIDREEAIRLVNLSTSFLRDFDSSPRRDHGSAQNLHPLSRLEDDLHFRFGNRAWVPMAIEMGIIGGMAS